MNLKPGVSLDGIKSEIKDILSTIESIFIKQGFSLTLTCTTGGHSELDPHSYGYAVDIRTHNIPVGIQRSLVAAIQQSIGPTYYIKLETPGTPNEHIHVQVRKDIWRKLEGVEV